MAQCSSMNVLFINRLNLEKFLDRLGQSRVLNIKDGEEFILCKN